MQLLKASDKVLQLITRELIRRVPETICILENIRCAEYARTGLRRRVELLLLFL